MTSSAVDSVNAVEYYLDRHLTAGRSSRRAFATHNASWTYGELLEYVERAAHVLIEAGVKHEDRVLLVLTDSIEAVGMLLASIRIGAVAVPIPTQMTDDEYAFICADCRPAIAVIEAEHVVCMRRIRATVGWPRTLLLAGEDNNDAGTDVQALADALTVAKRCEPVRVHADDTALLQYTSGSTGAPKGVVHLHRGLLALPQGFGQRLRLSEQDVCYSTAKLFFGYGLGNSVLFPLSAGASAWLRAEPSDPLGVLGTIQDARPTVVFGGPALYSALLAVGGAEHAYDFASVRLYVSAGDALSSALFTRWKQRFGHEILDGLGSTECLHIFLAGEQQRLRAGEIGSVVAPYEVRLLDDHGAPVQPGRPGHLHVRGPANGARYWNRPEATRATMVDGWVRTGDLLAQEPHGAYRYMGRSDDIFKVRGMKVSPTEIEQLLNAHAAVIESAVVSSADANGLAVACAYVRVADGAQPGAELARELRASLRKSLSAHKVPKRFEFVDALPRTSTGKLARHKLRELALPPFGR